MNVRMAIKRILGIVDPAPNEVALQLVTEEAARARTRLGRVIDQWHRDEVELRDKQQLRPRPAEVFVPRYFPQADFIRDQGRNDAGD